MNPTFLYGFRATALMVFLALSPTVSTAQDAVNTDADNVAIGGYDPVAYYTESRAVPGDPAFRHEWHDAIWQFASAGNRALFATEPERYAPHYGGFCVGGMLLGSREPIDPEQWVIIDGKLFLAGSRSDIEIVMEDPEARIAAADENWQTLGLTE